MKKETLITKEKINGITLIALIITIIVLLILAGVSIVTLKGDNGILNRATASKEESLRAQLKEEIQMGIYQIQIDNNGIVSLEKIQMELQNVEDLTGITVNNVENNILTGEYKGYNYEIDDKFNVKIMEKVEGININYELNISSYTKEDVLLTINATSTNGNIQSIEGPTELTQDQNGRYIITKNGKYEFYVTDSTNNIKAKTIEINNIDKEKPIINDITVSNIETNSFKVKVDAKDSSKTESSAESGISKYQYYITKQSDNNYQLYSEESQNELVIEGLEKSQTYNLKIIVIDNAGNEITGTEQTIKTLDIYADPLEYPIIFSTGIFNAKDKDGKYFFNESTKCTAEDAIQAEAYDGKDDTGVAGLQMNDYTVGRKIANIDSSAIGKKINVKWGAVQIEYSWSRIIFVNDEGKELYESEFVNKADITVDIPEGATKILYGGQVNARLFEMKIVE